MKMLSSSASDSASAAGGAPGLILIVMAFFSVYAESESLSSWCLRNSGIMNVASSGPNNQAKSLCKHIQVFRYI
jgi:hypothetical protein